ncbi:MAG: hypothetical protein CBC01_02335 [Betaproteobacteria bacterium TMED41]|nr:MAG: hypothetical protein CBC01_02335 [Betaproteobacteria bacterium TMED41]
MCSRGLEDSLVDELYTFDGVESIRKNKSGANFNASPEIICRLNLWARIPSRILIQLGKTQINNADELLIFANKINWGEWFTPSNSFRVDVNITGKLPRSMSANFVALKFKDGMCDRFRADFNGKRPTVNTKNPEIRIWIHFFNSLVTASIDTSGEPLFKRGWRQNKGIAPIKENLVSALLGMTNWDMSKPLMDPMCGSGTFVIEAMQKFTQLPCNYTPSRIRKFAFENFSPGSPFNNTNWKVLLQEAHDRWEDKNKIIKNIPLVIGSDSNIKMLEVAKLNAWHALPNKISKSIVWKVNDFLNYNASEKKISSSGILVTNPPFGFRIKLSENEKKIFIEKLGTVLKKNFSGWTVWILTNEKRFSSIIHLRNGEKFPVFNGDIACNWLSFEMVTGNMKNNYEI